MYFITEKNSETDKKFQELEKKRDIAIAETKLFAEKFNIKQWRGAYWQVWGGCQVAFLKKNQILKYGEKAK